MNDRDDRPAITLSGPIIDCDDVPRLTRFYADFLGWSVEQVEEQQLGGPPGSGMTRLTSPDGSAVIEIQFEPHFAPPAWPSTPGAQIKQIHLDFHVVDVAAGVRWAIECGATEADTQPQDRNLDRLRVMIDPAGHPFCLWG